MIMKFKAFYKGKPLADIIVNADTELACENKAFLEAERIGNEIHWDFDADWYLELRKE